MKVFKILNLYAGIGGNRKNWPETIVINGEVCKVEVTAVEFDPEIAGIYKKNFPQDTVIVGDAHAYLLAHYLEFDFIWSSCPCQTHGRPRFWASKGGRYEPEYPDMKLWQEIIFLKNFFKGEWVVENVIPYYDLLLHITPTVELSRHYFWSNFPIKKREFEESVSTWSVTSSTEKFGFSVKDEDIKHRKDQIIRNLVNPDLGLYILEQSRGVQRIDKSDQLKIAI